MKAKTIICAAMAAASVAVGTAARGDARPPVAHECRPAFKGEFVCGVNFGFYAPEGYYESQPAQEVMRRHYTQMAKPGK